MAPLRAVARLGLCAGSESIIGGVKGERIKVKVARGRVEQVDVAGKKGDET